MLKINISLNSIIFLYKYVKENHPRKFNHSDHSTPW
jgi:hypothetical protein